MRRRRREEPTSTAAALPPELAHIVVEDWVDPAELADIVRRRFCVAAPDRAAVMAGALVAAKLRADEARREWKTAHGVAVIRAGGTPTFRDASAFLKDAGFGGLS